jgi:fructose-1,6-bisphosphatase/inositol monophosphatase family enzyme
MNSSTLIQIVDTARDVAREVIMPHFLTAQRNLKDDGSLFTVVDLAAQEALIERLPHIIDRPVLGEEMPESLQFRLWHENQEGIWCIDPIDGTTNFVNGIPFFGVAIAYIAEGRTRFGVVHNPMTDETFYAEEGGGAFLNGTALPLRAPAKHLLDAVAGVDFKRIPKPLADALATQSPFYSQRNFGSSALEWCFVAAARLDVYLHGGQMMWDFAAGSLIAAEAGAHGSMLDGASLDMSPCHKTPVVVGASPALYREWMDWLDTHGSR